MDRHLALILAALSILLFRAPAHSQGLGNASLVLLEEAASPMDICGAASTFEVLVVNTTGAVMPNPVFEADFPVGVVFDGIAATASPGLSVVDASDPGKPLLRLPTPFLSGDSAVVAINARANCDLFPLLDAGQLPQNRYEVRWAENSFYNPLDGNEYSNSIEIPVIPVPFVNPADLSINAGSGQRVYRHITIYNSSFTSGDVDTLWFSDVFDTTGLAYRSIQYFNSALGQYVELNDAQWEIYGDSVSAYFLPSDFINAGIGATLGQSEQFLIREELSPTSCPDGTELESRISAWFGCYGQICPGFGEVTASIRVIDKNPFILATPDYNAGTCALSGQSAEQGLNLNNLGEGGADQISIVIEYPEQSFSGAQYGSFRIVIEGDTSSISEIDTALSSLSGDIYSCLGSSAVRRTELILPQIPGITQAKLVWEELSCCPSGLCGNLYFGGWSYDGAYGGLCDSIPNYSFEGSGETEIALANAKMVYTEDGIIAGSGTHSIDIWLPVFIYEGFGDSNDDSLYLSFNPSSSMITHSEAGVDVRLLDRFGSFIRSADRVFFDGFEYQAVFSLNGVSISSISQGSIEVDLQVSCPPCTPDFVFNLDLELSVDPDPSCSGSCRLPLACAAPSFLVRCPPCGTPCVGPELSNYQLYRKNYGLLDNDDDGIADASSPADTSLAATNRVTFLDTLIEKWTIDFNGSETYRGLIAQASLEGLDDFRLISASMNFTDASSGLIYSCNTLSTSANFDTANIELSPGLISSCAGLPLGLEYGIGDQIQLELEYVLNRNIGENIRSGLSLPKLKASTISATTGFADAICETSRTANFVVIGYRFETFEGEPFIVPTCDTGYYRPEYRFKLVSLAEGGNFFPFEYRNFVNLHKVKYAIPSGFNYRGAELEFLRTNGFTSYVEERIPLNNIGTASEVHFDILADFAAAGVPLGDDGFRGILNLAMSPDNCSQSDTIVGQDFSFAFYSPTGQVPSSVLEDSFTVELIEANPQSILQGAPSTVIGSDTLVIWDVYLENPSSEYESPNTWLYLDTAASSLQNIRLYDSLGNLLSPTDGLYQFELLGPNERIPLRIEAFYDACSAAELNTYVGWNCDPDAYPSDFSTYSCNTELSTLKVLPGITSLQMLTYSPDSSTALCDSFTLIADVASVQVAKAYENKLRFTMPLEGLEWIPGSFEIRYPANSGTWTALGINPDSIGASVSGVSYGFNFDSLALSGSLPAPAQLLLDELRLNGLASGVPPVTPTDSNGYRLRMQFNSSCGVVSGSKIVFEAEAVDPCGNPTNKISKTTLGIPIGDPDSLVNSYDLNWRFDTLVYCSNSPTDISLRVLNLGPLETDSIWDELILSFPLGISYVAGSSGLGLDPVIDTVGFDQIWTFPLLDGLEVDSIWRFDFSIEFLDTTYTGASATGFAARAEIFTSFPAVCQSSLDTCRIGILAAEHEDYLYAGSSEIDFELVRAVSACEEFGGIPQERVLIEAEIINNSDVSIIGELITVEYYWDADNDGEWDRYGPDLLLSTQISSEAILAGESIELSTTFSPGLTQACPIIIVLDTLSNPCLLSEPIIIPNISPRLQNAGDDIEICPGESASLGCVDYPGYTYWWYSIPPASNTWFSIRANHETVFTPPANSTGSPITYSLVLATDRGICLTRDTVQVTLNPDATGAILSGDTSICEGVEIEISAILPGDSSANYQWIPSSLVVGDDDSSHVIVRPTTATSFYVDISNQYGCIDRDTIFVAVDKAPDLMVSADTSLCAGSSYAMSVQDLLDSTTSFLWTPNIALDDPLSANPISSPITDINYTVTATAISGCQSDADVSIQVDPVPSINLFSDTAFFCDGSSQTLSASLINAASFYWSPGNILDDSLSINPLVSPDSSQWLSLYAQSASGCDAMASIFLEVGSSGDLDLGADTSICLGESVALNATGSGAFNWSPGTGLDCISCPNPVASPSVSTIYSVELDLGGCIIRDTIFIEVNQLPEPDFFAAEVCPGENTIFINLTDTSSISISSWYWEFDDSLGTSSTATDPVFVYPEPNGGEFNVLLQAVSSEGCQAQIYETVTVHPTVASATLDSVLICFSESAALSATGGSSYSWFPSTGLDATIVPNPNASPDSSTWYFVDITNDFGCTVRDSVFVEVLPLPIAEDEFGPITEDASLPSIDLLANDTVFYSSSLFWLPSEGPYNGTAILNFDGTLGYTPDPDFNGLDSMQYLVCSDVCLDACDTAVVTFNVIPVNDPPVAIDDLAFTTEDVAVIIPVLGNDFDPDIMGGLNPASVAVIDLPIDGSVAVSTASGEITYFPNTGFSGVDNFIYRVCDTGFPTPTQCDTADVQVVVLASGSGPSAFDDFASTVSPNSVLIEVLSNDAAGDSPLNPASVVVLSPPNHGTAVAISPSGIIQYIPDSRFCGLDSFTYQVCDLSGTCANAQVLVDVICVEPIAVRDEYSTDFAVPISMPVLNNDIEGTGLFDLSTLDIAFEPENGDAAVDTVSGTILYSPFTFWCGRDSLRYRICDQNDLCASAWAIIDVSCPDFFVEDDSATTNQGVPVLIDVLSNDASSAAAWCANLITWPDIGWAEFDDDGLVLYTPTAEFTGRECFFYQVCDSQVLQIDTAMICVEVVGSDLVHIPNVFTPNGDGQHETFVIDGLQNYPNNELIVFNRWENQVFAALSYQNDWRGTWERNGENLPDDTYYYILKLDRLDPESPVFVGYTTIWRGAKKR